MRFITTFILVAFCWSAQANGQLRFNFDITGNTGLNSNAAAGLQQAADFWSAQFSDDIAINVRVRFVNMGPGFLAEAESTDALYSYSDFKAALDADTLSADDATYSSSLPAGNDFSVYINRTSESFVAFVDDDGGANNTQVLLNNANAKALGLLPSTQAGEDVEILVTNGLLFDFDASDGISTGRQNFVGIAIHEIGHAMGFTSGVATLDASGTGFNDDFFTEVSALDFARHSPDSIAAGADLDFTADTRPKFYSIDGGVTAGGGLVGGLDHFSLGPVNGDGRSASHWRDGNLGDRVQLGILDPTINGAGNLDFVTALDLQALDIIGFDPIFPLGDVNRDGTVDFLDISPFITLLFTSTFQLEADINGDGGVGFLDVLPFITLLAS